MPQENLVHFRRCDESPPYLPKSFFPSARPKAEECTKPKRQKRETQMLVVQKTSNTEYEPAPEGTHLSVLADVTDLGKVETPWGTKSKVLLTWETEDTDSEGRRYRLFKRFNLSLHEKSGLYQAVKSMLGVVPDGPFDLDTLIGTNSNLVVTHETNNGKTYTRVAAILRVKTRNLKVSSDFVRKQDKDKTANGSNSGVPKAVIPPMGTKTAESEQLASM